MPIQRGPFSDYLHRRRQTLAKPWKQVLSDAYLSRATLHRIRHGDPHHPIAEVDSLRSLAHALRFASWADLVAAFDANDVKAGLNGSSSPMRMNGESDHQDAVLSLSRALNVSPTEVTRRLALGGARVDGAELQPVGLRMYEKQPGRMVRHYASGVAASRRVEKLEDENFDSQSPAGIEDTNVFTIPVDGDCQEPVYHDGDLVVFSFDAYEREGILMGKSYYLAFTDGTTTFKRVFLDPLDPKVYVLRCWNVEKYPDERRVHFREVTRIARAMSRQVVPEE